jgi:WD40 repeat protein
MPLFLREMILAARFSPDGRYLYGLTVSVAGSRFLVWDLKGDAAGRVLGQAHVQGLPSSPFSPDGRLLAFASRGKKVVLWSVAGNRVEREIELPLEPSGAIGFAPDGTLGIVAALTDEKAAGQSVGPKTLLIWDVANNRQVQRIDSIPSYATGISFAPGRARVAVSNGRDGSIVVVDVTGRKPPVRLNGRMITQLLAWSDGRHLLSGGIGSLKDWEFAEESPLSDLRLEGAPAKGFDGPLGFSPNGRVLAVEALGRPYVDLFDPTTGKLLRRLDPSDKVPPLRLSFSPDGKQIVRVGFQSAIAWDVETGTQRCRLDAKMSDARSLGSVGFCADGRILVGESDDEKPAVAEMASGKVIWRGSKPSVFSALLSRNGRFATTFSVSTTENQQSLPLIDLSTGRELYQLPGSPNKLIQTLCEFSPDARWLLTLHLGTLAAAGLGGSVPVGHDAARLLTSEMADQPWNGEIWDVPSGTRHMQINGLSDPVAYAFSHDGRYLAVGMANGAIRFWDMQGREELFDWFPFADQSQESHAGRNLAFTAEGATLVLPSPVSPSLRLLNLIRVNEQLGTAALNW